MKHLIVVGAGLTGLFAAALAAARGARVTLVARGRGSLALSHGCIDLWATKSPSRSIRRLRHPHPYALAGGFPRLQSALADFIYLLDRQGIEYHGAPSRNHRLITALGTAHLTALAPFSLAAGDLNRAEPIVVAGFEGFFDFSPHLVASGLQRQGADIQDCLTLPLIELPPGRERFATDLARLFETPEWRRELARSWKPRLTGVRHLALPAVLGLEHNFIVWQELQDLLALTISEIPTLPPSLPGIRLERALRRSLSSAGVQIIEGSRAVGRVDGRSGGQLVSGVVLQTAGGPRLIAADAVILATGGVLNGGLVFHEDGRVQESVFDLPVAHDDDRTRWLGSDPFGSHPYALFGLHVDQHMRPLGANAKPAFENLFAAGSLLAGADRSREGSRQGIDLATAHCAVEAALA